MCTDDDTHDDDAHDDDAHDDDAHDDDAHDDDAHRYRQLSDFLLHVQLYLYTII